MSAQATTIEREPGGQGLAVVAGALPRGQLALVTVLSVLGSMSEGLGLVLLVPILHLIGTDGSADAGPTGTIGRL